MEDAEKEFSPHDRLWVALSRAIHTCPAGESILARRSTPPWESQDEAVRKAWLALTDPKNLVDLEARCHLDEMNPHARAASQEALRMCRERARSN